MKLEQMKTSPMGMMQLIGIEGIVLNKYLDSGGVMTIGIGKTSKAGILIDDLPDEITIRQAIEYFRQDIKKYERNVKKAFKVELTQEQFDAAVSFDYNTGSIRRAAWVRHFNNGNVARAERGIMDWTKQKYLTPRRRKEQKLFFSGKYSTNCKAAVSPAEGGRIVRSKTRVVNLKPYFKSKKKSNATTVAVVGGASALYIWFPEVYQFFANLF